MVGCAAGAEAPGAPLRQGLPGGPGGRPRRRVQGRAAALVGAGVLLVAAACQCCTSAARAFIGLQFPARRRPSRVLRRYEDGDGTAVPDGGGEATAVVGEGPDADRSSPFERAAARVLEHLRTASRRVEPEIAEELYEMSPELPAEVWRDLEEEAENLEDASEMDPEQWTYFHYRIVNFEEVVDRLMKAGILPGPRRSDAVQALEDALLLSTRILRSNWNGFADYSHGDEIHHFVPPSEKPLFGARLMKWLSVSPGALSGSLNREIMTLASTKGLRVEADMLFYYVARAVTLESATAVEGMLALRARDAEARGLQAACLRADAPEEVSHDGALAQLRWLKAAGLLPLDRHRAHGTLLVKNEFEFVVPIIDTEDAVNMTRKGCTVANFGAAGTPVSLLNCPSAGLAIVPDMDLKDGPEDPRLCKRDGNFHLNVAMTGELRLENLTKTKHQLKVDARERRFKEKKKERRSLPLFEFGG